VSQAMHNLKLEEALSLLLTSTHEVVSQMHEQHPEATEMVLRSLLEFTALLADNLIDMSPEDSPTKH